MMPQLLSKDIPLIRFVMEEMVNGDESKEVLEAQAHIWKYTFNYITSMSLKCAVQLGIPDIIANHGKPLNLSLLVKQLSIPHLRSPHLYQLMRILVHSGFFALEEEGYVLTPSSKLLLSKNHNTNLSPFVLMMMDPVLVTPFHFLTDWFQGNQTTAFKVAHGMEMWDYYGQHSDVNKSFDDSLAGDSGLVMGVVLKHCKAMFEGFGSVVDVGGSTGSVAKAISEVFPLMRCTVLDLPHVVSHMKGTKNLEFIGGDMFQSIPHADIILLKWIMHDWSDEKCLKILKNCKEAISEHKGGKVIIIDIVLDEDQGLGRNDSIETQLCLDILMMVSHAAKERTEAEWKKLFLDAGFSSFKITRGLGLRSIIEVFP